MDSNSHDKMRPVVEAIKASWKDDPCWDLHEFDAEAEELPHLIPYQAELRQFAIDTRAKWDAEVKAAAVATIDAVVKRIVDRSEAETAGRRCGLASCWCATECEDIGHTAECWAVDVETWATRGAV